uniref:dachshund homolog 1-like isoform X2 n=1 Tax=Myxine glutinosa TaxID=7769 RepID=UPI00358FCE3F
MSMTDRAALSAIGVSPVISVPSRDASALTGRDSRCSGAPSSPCRSPLGLARPELGPLHLLEHRCGYTSPSPVENTPSNNECLLVCMRGARVAAFVVHGQEMLCLPQVFELFLKNLVGGLHTVYTKLKRLRISPVVCNVEQVRVLRRLGAIQPGVNRCKLLSRRDFEELYRDCTSAGSRPGRPPKRTPPDGATRTSLHCTPPRSVGADVSIQGRLTSDPCNAQLQSSNMTPVCVAHLRAQYLRSGQTTVSNIVVPEHGQDTITEQSSWTTQPSVIRGRGCSSPCPSVERAWERERCQAPPGGQSSGTYPGSPARGCTVPEQNWQYDGPVDISEPSSSPPQHAVQWLHAQKVPVSTAVDPTKHAGLHLQQGLPSPLPSPHCSTAELLSNVQALLEEALETTRIQEVRWREALGEARREVARERHLRDAITWQLKAEREARVMMQKRLKREKKAKRKVQEMFEAEKSIHEEAKAKPSTPSICTRFSDRNNCLDGIPSQEAQFDTQRTVPESKLYYNKWLVGSSGSS